MIFDAAFPFEFALEHYTDTGLKSLMCQTASSFWLRTNIHLTRISDEFQK